MNDESPTGSGRPPDASVVAACDVRGRVALLSAVFPRHGGEHLFLPGGRREKGESSLECARRELREEAGISAADWRPLGSFAITLASTARVHLFHARRLTLGPHQRTPSEADFTLDWWPLSNALAAAEEGRFLLPAGPLALLLVDRAGRTAAGAEGTPR